MRVQPRASRDSFGGERNGALVVRLTAPPLDGEANAALVRLLARKLRIAPTSIRILRGEAARDKLLRIEGASASAIRACLEAPRASGARSS